MSVVLEDRRIVDLRARVERPLRAPAPLALAIMGALAGLVVLGVVAWVRQWRTGLGVTGLNDSVVWGLYIATFVFFIGISMAGTLVSAILRLAGAEWRRPITRIAEIITVASLLVALAMITADMGRPDRLLSILWNANLRSPIVWDVISITTYLIGSLLYVGLPLIPDLALLRDTGEGSWLRRRFYRIGSFGWTGRAAQHRRLERAIAMTALIVIPSAIAVHSVTAWLFGMTLREGWSSPLMAPYFVASALFSGTAVIVLVLAAVRRIYGLADIITEDHLARLGRLLLLFGIGYAYLTFAEYLTAGYKMREGEADLLLALSQGRYAGLFWTSVIGGTIVPVALLSTNRRTVRRVLTASSMIVLGMMVKRFLIVVPSLGLPLMPVGWATYRPTLTEIRIVVGAFAAFALIIMVFAHLVPIISVTEVAEGLTVSEEHGPSDGNGGRPRKDPQLEAGGSEPPRGRRSRRVPAMVATMFLFGIASIPAFAHLDEIPEQDIVISASVRDVSDRPLPGAVVRLVLDVRLFGEKRAAVVDERRTDQQGNVLLRWSRPFAGKTTGRVVFDGAAIWNGSERSVVFDVAKTSERQREGSGLPWLRAELILIPVLIVWALLAHAAVTGLRIGRIGDDT